MAYGLSDRFPKQHKYYPLLDPGTYTTVGSVRIKRNRAPFLSRTPRITQPASKIWTHVIYSADHPRRIANCSAMMSRRPRFPWDILKKEDIREIICECNSQQTCECVSEKKKKDVKSESKPQQQIFIGPLPRANIDSDSPFRCKRNEFNNVFLSKNDKDIHKKGHKRRSCLNDNEPGVLTDYYKGCKWSRWTSKRTLKSLNEGPSPTSYTIKQEPPPYQLCAEKERANRRKTSRQYRYIDMIQKQNLKENLPGPATYNPQYPKGTDLQFLGPRAKRFTYSKYYIIPGPADYKVKRDFDLPELLENRCHAKLGRRSAFGMNAPRFKSIKHEGPGPASYDTSHQICMVKHCLTAPFGSSSVRFTDIQCEDEISDDEDTCSQTKDIECEKLKESWMFKSRTVRMNKLKKKLIEPSPADMPLRTINRSKQNTAPFATSEARFQPWYNWIPVYNVQDTPAPGDYNPEKVLCIPAVVRGPVFRSERFKCDISQTPPCNAYKVSEGLEAVLRTHNTKLKENITKKHEYDWKPFSLKKKSNDKERVSHLINSCLNLLNTDMFCAEQTFNGKQILNRKIKKVENSKMLRSFLYKSVLPNYF